MVTSAEKGMPNCDTELLHLRDDGAKSLRPEKTHQESTREGVRYRPSATRNDGRNAADNEERMDDNTSWKKKDA